MSDRELYQQKRKAQLDEWRAEVAKLRAKASGARADAQLEMNEKIKVFESRIEEGKAKLSQLADSSDDAWDSLKDGVESAWDTLKSAAADAAGKFKR